MLEKLAEMNHPVARVMVVMMIIVMIWMHTRDNRTELVSSQQQDKRTLCLSSQDGHKHLRESEMGLTAQRAYLQALQDQHERVQYMWLKMGQMLHLSAVYMGVLIFCMPHAVVYIFTMAFALSPFVDRQRPKKPLVVHLVVLSVLSTLLFIMVHNVLVKSVRAWLCWDISGHTELALTGLHLTLSIAAYVHYSAEHKPWFVYLSWFIALLVVLSTTGLLYSTMLFFHSDWDIVGGLFFGTLIAVMVEMALPIFSRSHPLKDDEERL